MEHEMFDSEKMDSTSEMFDSDKSDSMYDGGFE
jgi:hypothetical protein